jgi:drug/metabolite transporter (DMT)-like permease
MNRPSMMVILVAIGVGWGLTQPLGKMAASSGRGAVGLVFWQLVICALVLGALTIWRKKTPPLSPSALRFYGVVALLGTVVPGMIYYISAARLPAGIMSILISTVPMIAFPLGVLLGTEIFQWRRLLGLLLGLCGVLIIVLPKASLPDRLMSAYIPLALIGPLFYALEGNYVARSQLLGMDQIQAMFGASIFGLVVTAPVMFMLGQEFMIRSLDVPDIALIASSGLHALLYASFIWLITKAGAVFATQTGYIVTVAGIFWSMLILGEQMTIGIFLAAGVMLAGVALVQPRSFG